MKLRDLELPIVNKNWMGARANDPWRTVSTQFSLTWNHAAAQLPPYQRGSFRQLLRMLDTMMWLTGLALPAEINTHTFAEFDLRIKQLAGAVFSSNFFHSGEASKKALARGILKIRRKISENVGAPLTWNLPVTSTDNKKLISKLVSLVDNLDIQPHLVNECRGWACMRKSDSITYHRLTPLADKFSYNFANEFFLLCEIYHSKRRKNTCAGADVLGDFISTMVDPPPEARLKDSRYTTTFFAHAFEHWMSSSSSKDGGCSLEGLVTLWRGEISNFFNEQIFPSGLIAEPLGGLPRPRSLSAPSRETNVKKAAEGEVHGKLLTQVPLELGDDEAFELVFRRIKADLQQAKDWAWAEVTRCAGVLKRRKQLGVIGTPRKVLPFYSSEISRGGSTDWSNAEHLANAAATFEQHGYPCYGQEFALSPLLFPSPRRRWAEELAIPTSGFLLPHCAVIVAEHPSVTPSFLENLQLFDSHDRMVGLVQADSGPVLVGAKMRRGPELAIQEVKLNDRSLFAVDQIIQLTEPLRKFLREKNDSNWRYLLLSSAKGFAYPSRVTNLSSCASSPHGLQALEASFSRVLGLSDEDARDFAKRFSLSALRASAATQVYFDTRSVQVMSRALGHMKYDVTLLQRYLPAPIRMFFEERWIRLFQTGIIVEALSESKYRLEASGFASIDELHAFMTNHALRLPPSTNQVNVPECDQGWDIGNLSSPRETIFGLNTEILTTLLSLDLATRDSERKVVPKARYWADVSRELIPYVERASLGRPDIHSYLKEARARASSTLVEHLAYE